MANAWLVKPLPIVGTPVAFGTAVAGLPEYAFNDFAGVTWSVLCDVTGNAGSIRFDLGSDQAIDTIMVFGVENIPANATFHANYATAAQGNFTGASSTTSGDGVYAGSVMPSSGRGVGLLALNATITARYLQINFIAGSAGKSIRVARIVVGKRIQLERNFSFGAAFGVRDLGKLDLSRRGVLLRTRGAKLRTAALTFTAARKDEVEASVKPLLEQVGNTEIVGLVLDPAADAQRQNRCYCGPLVGDLSVVWRNAAAFEAKVAVLSLF